MVGAGVGDEGQGTPERSANAHRPVLLEAAIDALSVKPDGLYVDGTFGRGGHSAAIRARLGREGCLVAIDRDPQAVTVGRAWAQEETVGGRVFVEHAWFSQLDQVLDGLGLGSIDGLLLDLGVSSPQLDDPSRGFSFREDGPLDMRMDTTRGESAREWLMRASVQEIKEALRDYGEERFAFQIATAVVARRGAGGETALQTTGELARLVADIYLRRQKRPEVGKNPATRTFQAIRILVNQELAELEVVLEQGLARLRPGGRLVVISFHSIEDRMVKQFISRESGRNARRDPIMGTPVHDRPPRLRAVARVLPDELETKNNPRARSAVLRVAERIAA